MRERVQVVSGSDVYLGLDISKTSWHVTARSGGETLMSASFPPKREALNGLLERLEGCRVHSAYETGPFGYGLHDWLRSRQVRPPLRRVASQHSVRVRLARQLNP